MLADAFWVIIASFIIAGLGEALVNPALSAAYLDITPEEHRSRAMGIKTAIGSLGSLLAPALVTIVGSAISPQVAFLVSTTLILFTAVVVLVVLRVPSRAEAVTDVAWEASQERVMAAQTALRNLTVGATTVRQSRGAA